MAYGRIGNWKYREAWEYISEMEQMVQELLQEHPEADYKYRMMTIEDKKNHFIAKAKRELRESYKRSCKAQEENPIPVSCRESGEYWTEKWFCSETWTEEEKQEYIEENWERVTSPYDCSGQRFTTSITICNFKQPNSIGAMSVIYTSYAIDC